MSAPGPGRSASLPPSLPNRSPPATTPEAYFASATEPERLPGVRTALADFVRQHADRKIALVTSGGTTVPLEKNTVRFIDNFSTGNRGASSAEQFLKADYAVVFMHRRHSAFPFARRFTPPALSAQELLRRAGTEAHAALVTAAAAEYAQYEPRLLALPFQSVDEYLHLLRAACQALAPAGPRALLYLAAAVSDFFVPAHELATHKIQSGGSGGGSADGGLTLQLRPVPKLLAAIKRGDGGAAGWAPRALLVSFKLETNEAILKAKAAAAIAKYGVDVVVANRLQTYHHEVPPRVGKGPSALVDDRAPSARLVPPRAQAAPTHPRAQPQPLRSSPWLQELASGRPKVAGLCTFNHQVTLMRQEGEAAPKVLASQVEGNETEEVAVSGVSCRQISTRKRDAAAVDGSGGDVAPVDIEVPLLAALVETHAANIAAAE